MKIWDEQCTAAYKDLQNFRWPQACDVYVEENGWFAAELPHSPARLQLQGKDLQVHCEFNGQIRHSLTTSLNIYSPFVAKGLKAEMLQFSNWDLHIVNCISFQQFSDKLSLFVGKQQTAEIFVSCNAKPRKTIFCHDTKNEDGSINFFFQRWWFCQNKGHFAIAFHNLVFRRIQIVQTWPASPVSMLTRSPLPSPLQTSRLWKHWSTVCTTHWPHLS